MCQLETFFLKKIHLPSGLVIFLHYSKREEKSINKRRKRELTKRGTLFRTSRDNFSVFIHQTPTIQNNLGVNKKSAF